MWREKVETKAEGPLSCALKPPPGLSQNTSWLGQGASVYSGLPCGRHCVKSSVCLIFTKTQLLTFTKGRQRHGEIPLPFAQGPCPSWGGAEMRAQAADSGPLMLFLLLPPGVL